MATDPLKASAICRVRIESQPASGSRNMAVDEVLLESAVRDEVATFRWYRWEEATLSLGYFQTADAASEFPLQNPIPVVRRLSGGGAILHHHEWTYSWAIPAWDPLVRRPSQVYEIVHNELVRWFREQQVDARLRGAATAQQEGDVDPFLCFGRGDSRDIVLDGGKIVGSAQRRRKGAVLQHGSVLMERSALAPEFAGIRDTAPEFQIDEASLEAWTERLLQSQGYRAEFRELTTEEERRTAELQRQRYDEIDWTGNKERSLT